VIRDVCYCIVRVHAMCVSACWSVSMCMSQLYTTNAFTSTVVFKAWKVNREPNLQINAREKEKEWAYRYYLKKTSRNEHEGKHEVKCISERENFGDKKHRDSVCQLYKIWSCWILCEMAIKNEEWVSNQDLHFFTIPNLHSAIVSGMCRFIDPY